MDAFPPWASRDLSNCQGEHCPHPISGRTNKQPEQSTSPPCLLPLTQSKT